MAEPLLNLHGDILQNVLRCRRVSHPRTDEPTKLHGEFVPDIGQHQAVEVQVAALLHSWSLRKTCRESESGYGGDFSAWLGNRARREMLENRGFSMMKGWGSALASLLHFYCTAS